MRLPLVKFTRNECIIAKSLTHTWLLSGVGVWTVICGRESLPLGAFFL